MLRPRTLRPTVADTLTCINARIARRLRRASPCQVKIPTLLPSAKAMLAAA